MLISPWLTSSQSTPPPPLIHPYSHPDKGWWTYGTWTQNGMQKDFLGMWHSLLSLFFLFHLPDQHLDIVKKTCVCVCVYVCACMCVCTCTCTYTYIDICVRTVYELPLPPNNTASETFLHKSGAVWSVDWVFIIGALAWLWKGKYVRLDRTFFFMFMVPCIIIYSMK